MRRVGHVVQDEPAEDRRIEPVRREARLEAHGRDVAGEARRVHVLDDHLLRPGMRDRRIRRRVCKGRHELRCARVPEVVHANALRETSAAAPAREVRVPAVPVDVAERPRPGIHMSEHFDVLRGRARRRRRDRERLDVRCRWIGRIALVAGRRRDEHQQRHERTEDERKKTVHEPSPSRRGGRQALGSHREPSRPFDLRNPKGRRRGCCFGRTPSFHAGRPARRRLFRRRG